MELDGAFREVEIGGNFFVGETVRNAGEDFFFAAREPHLAVNGLTGFEQLVGFLNEVFQYFVFGLDQNGVIAGTLPPNEAMHSEKPGGLINGKTAVGAGLNMKMGHSRILFVKEEDIAVRHGARRQQLLRIVTSADHLHVHPLRMQPRDGPKLLSFF